MNWDGRERRNDTPLSERVAVLEEKAEQQDKKLDQIIAGQEALEAQLSRFHGAIGAVAFLITGIGVAWEIFGGWFKEHWK